MKVIVVLLITIFISAHVYAEDKAADKITVKAAKVSEVAIYPQHSAPASIISLNESVISAQIAARVDALSVRVGDIILIWGSVATAIVWGIGLLNCADLVCNPDVVSDIYEV